MSRSISIFVKHSNIQEVVGCVSNFIGHSVNKIEGENSNIFSAYVLGLDIRIFHAHGYEDDRGIPFTRYSTVVDLQSINTMYGFELLYQFSRSGALLLAGQLVRFLNCECIVVENCQHLLAIFPQPVQ